MKILTKMILKSFILAFIVSTLFFAMVIELLDIFMNLWRYNNNNVSISSILYVALLFLPKCIFFAIPVSTLFAVSYTLGNMYSKNELTAVFGSGIPIFIFTLPFIFSGIIISFLTFVFHESVVTITFMKKNALTAELLQTKKSFNNNSITVLESDREIIYSAEYYNDSSQTLSSVLILDRREDQKYPVRIDSQFAKWNDVDEMWTLTDCRIYSYDSDIDQYIMETKRTIEEPAYSLVPTTFRKIVRNIEEMNVQEAGQWVRSLRKAGLPYREQLTEYYKRFSFPLTCFIVAIIASYIGGNFKKNILLMCLLLSLLLATGYYILQMVLFTFAKLGYISPITGAWGAFVFFMFFSIVIVKYAKT